MSSLAITQTRISLFSFYYLIPFALLVMTGSSISFLSSLCSSNNRWIALFSVFIIFILKRDFFRYFDWLLFTILFSYFGWCFFTSFWSEVPTLSFMKSGLALVVVFTMIRTGIEWVRINPLIHSLNYVWLIAFFSLLSCILGTYAPDEITYTKIGFGVTYQGLVSNSNMLGMFMTMSLPFFIWKSYKSFPNLKKMIIWSMLTGSCLYWLILSFSRSAILASTLILSGFLFSLRLDKKLKLFLLSFVMSIMALLLFPSILGDIEEHLGRWAYKGNYSSLFHSRQESWQKSYNAASNGGWIGFGYGASKGQTEFSLNGTLKSYYYGREKGNSQLAIIEETGIIGLIFYLILIFYLVLKLFMLFIREKDPDTKVLVGILTGLFLGMIVHSSFEAWWDSPGSQESIYFWMLIGVIKGVEIFGSRKLDNYSIIVDKT